MVGFAERNGEGLPCHGLHYKWREVGQRGAGSRLYADGMELGTREGHSSLQSVWSGHLKGETDTFSDKKSAQQTSRGMHNCV